VDVLVSGTDDFIGRIAARHGASVKKSLKNGALLTVSPASLASMAEDGEIGAISSDAVMRSQLSLATESTGAAAAPRPASR
jgi:hypothetical protein